MGFVVIANLYLKHWVVSIGFALVKICVHLSLKRKSNVSVRRESSMKRHGVTYKKKYSLLLKRRSVNSWDCTKKANISKNIRENFPYRRSLTAYRLLEETKSGKFFSYVQRNIEKLKNVKANFANPTLIIRNTLVSKNDIRHLNDNVCRGRKKEISTKKKLISSFTIQNRNLITPLLLFYLRLGFSLQNYTSSLSSFRRIVPTALYNQQWTHEENLTRIQNLV